MARHLVGLCSLLVAADASPKVLLDVRSVVAEDSDAPEKLSAAVSKLKGDDELVATVRSGYEKLASMLSSPPADMKKLEKALAKASKKKALISSFDTDDTFLESKAEKKEREEKTAKASAAVDAAQAAVDEAKAAIAAREPRNVLFPRLSDIIARLAPDAPSDRKAKPKPAPVLALANPKATLQVLSHAPLVVAVDNWLGETGLKALDGAIQAATKALSPPADDGSADPGKSIKVPRNASELTEGPFERGARPSAPQLCVPIVNGQQEPTLVAAIDSAMEAAKAAKAKGDDHCDATASLVDEAPDGWDEAEDGAWVGTYKDVAARYPKGCGPLTDALDKALVNSDEVIFTASADAHVDVRRSHLAPSPRLASPRAHRPAPTAARGGRAL